MIDWVTISLALVIIATLVGIFAFMAWKINVSDPLLAGNVTGRKDDTNQLFDSDRKKKDKHGNDQSKKKRKEQKKSKRENNKEEEDDQQRHSVTFKEPSIQTSDETDNEREESEQESSTPQVVETAPKVRQRKKKAQPATPPSSSDHIEGILANKDEKSPVTTRPEPISHPILAHMIPKDEVELARQNQQKTKNQGKSTQGSTKQTAPPSPPIPVRKSAPVSNNANKGGQKQQQQQQQQQQLLQEQQEQPFTTVGGNRHKAGTPPSQQQNKPANVTTSTVAAPPPISPPAPQPQVPVQSQHEQLPQRAVAPPRQQRETPAPQNGFNANAQPVKQLPVASAAAAAAPPIKLADLVKALPTSQVVVTELMSALDAFPLSTDELDIIMHKIANKQSVIKQDWSRLQHGQKVDPQAHIGQVLDESARAYEEDMKTNALKRIKELSDERNNDKHRINDLLKEANEKDLSIQRLHAQLASIQHPQQQMQSFQVGLERLSEENKQLKLHLAQQQQQQQHFQQAQQQLSSMNLVPNNAGDSGNAQLRVLSEQVKKLSVDNGNFEKQIKAKDLLLKESQKQFQFNEEKLLKELNESRTLNNNQINEFKRRVEQLEKEKEQERKRRMEAESTPVMNNQEREKLEQLIQENEQYKVKLNETQNLKQELEQLKIKAEQDKNLHNQLTAANAQLDTLRAELETAKADNNSTKIQGEQQKQKQFLLELLQEDLRNQLPENIQDFDQWLSSYRQIFTSSIESNKRALQDRSTELQRENDQLHKNMIEVENQLKEIEQTVEGKEELLLADLKSKDAMLENISGENDQLKNEFQRLRAEIDRLQSAYNTSVNDNQALKLQLDERQLFNTNNSSTTADDAYEYLTQPSSAEFDLRADKLNELIGSTKEVIENQDSLVQQLDKYIDEMHRSGTGEISNMDDSTVSSSDQQQSQS